MTTGFVELDWYDTPKYYDIVFAEDTELEAAFLEAMSELYGEARNRRSLAVLEPACGSGRLIEAMALRGHRITGFDASDAMLDYARERLRKHGLTARLARRQMEDFAFRGRFDLAHCLVSTFKYLLDEQAARTHLECVARALAPGGIYVLGFHLTDYEATSKNRERWVAERDGAHVVCNIQGWPADRRRRVERVRSRLVVQEDGRTSKSETNWLFRTYDAAQVRRLLRSVPALEHVATYDFTYTLDEPRELDDDQFDVVLVLRKRGA